MRAPSFDSPAAVALSDTRLYDTSDLKTMTSIWLGLETVRRAVQDRHLKLVGDKHLSSTMQS